MNTAMMLMMWAPAIDAAGSYQRAKRAGLIGGELPGSVERSILSAVPRRLGGTLDHPDAEGDWRRMVDDLVRDRDIDMEQMRRFAANAGNAL